VQLLNSPENRSHFPYDAFRQALVRPLDKSLMKTAFPTAGSRESGRRCPKSP
jgi:hypothetical protein